MNLQLFEIEGLALLKPRIFSDDRGFFFESFNQDNFNKTIGKEIKFVQDNHSFSTKNVLRGIHFQLPPFGQGKLVRVIDGEVLDVAVDIRKNSKTYGKHVSVLLSGENKRQLFVPRGFAHGFLVLSDSATVAYKVDNIYAPEYDSGIKYNDKDLNINWSLTENEIQLSLKDNNLSFFKDLDSPFKF